MPYPSEISRLRDRFIEENERRFTRIAASLQRETFERVDREILSKLDVEGGKIKPTAGNLSKLARFKAIERDLRSGPRKDMIEWLLKKLEEQFKLARRYFRRLTGSSVLAADKDIAARFRAMYGVTKDGFVSRGVLYDLWNDASDIRSIQRNVANGVMSGAVASDLISETRRYVTGTPSKRGVVVRNIQNATLDVFPNNDNAVSKQYADALELNFAMYTGGLMDTSRDFCIERNGQIFHRSQIEDWRNFDWQGKSDPYNPYIDVGGYNCKHVLDWITNELAAARGVNLAAFGEQ